MKFLITKIAAFNNSDKMLSLLLLMMFLPVFAINAQTNSANGGNFMKSGIMLSEEIGYK